jgi:RNA polymerase sporulation-specific sigma factor
MKCVLKSRERTVIQLRYGLANGGSKTQREIAKLLGISRSY